MGVILAGGKSRRMRVNKALLKIGGTPMIQMAASAMQSVFEDVRVVADDAPSYGFLGLKTIPDVKKRAGPLGGIHAALHATAAGRVFVVGCDMPFVSAELIQFVLESAGTAAITVVSDGEMVQPLCGLYARSLLSEIESRLASGDLRLLSLIESSTHSVLTLNSSYGWYSDKLLKNINNQADFRSLAASERKQK